MAQMTDGGDRTNRRSLAQLVGLVLGITYLAVGLIGFAVTNGVEFAGTEGEKLLGLFEINPLHNVVHLAVGAALLWGATAGRNAARAINATVGATYLLVGIAGLFVSGNNDANVLALNAADNALHLGSAIVLLASAMMSTDTETRSATTTGTRGRTTTGTR
ncbi:MAG TPA: DUF4383 domain-containing protein [Frankiaceae bacterium]|jgi:hypothetical protein|nr:DUF4383 domain-containing protein [Frankiaceae bacterium]